MMKRVLTTAILAFGLVARTADDARAGGVPTIDVASITQQVAILMESISQTEIAGQSLSSLGKQLSELYDMGRTLDDQLSAITGARESIAGLFQSEIASLTGRMGDLQEIMDWKNATSPSGLAALVKDKAVQYAVVEGETLYGETVTDSRPRDHDERTSATLVALSVSERSYEDASAAMQRLDALRKEIGRATDLQSSVALNSRIQVELALLTAQQMQAQAAYAHMGAIRENASLRNYERRFRGRDGLYQVAKEAE